MKFGVLGTGMVGEAIASKLVERGHEVRIGSRSKTNENALSWAKLLGPKASVGTFGDAARFGDIVFNCVMGEACLDVLKGVGSQTLGSKVVVDVTNPLDFSKGMPPSLFVSNTDSLDEQIQRGFPTVRVVKALNSMTAQVMVKPGLIPGDHNVFLCGNDLGAKNEVSTLLSKEFGWKPANILDLGDLTAARGMEAVLLLWLRLMIAGGHPYFNFHIVRGEPPVEM